MSGLPREWCRGPQWASGDARTIWEPVLRSAQAAWSELELISVSAGLRDSALVYLAADELARAGADCARVGLAMSVLEHSEGAFRAAVHRPELAGAWHSAWAAHDHDAVGRMLGFPPCCRAFFAREWAATSRRDITPAMGTVDGPWEANTMLRQLGVRLVPHLPCSASCGETVSLARAYLRAGREAWLDAAALEAILRLPVTHDAQNGVAIVQTPHFRFLAGSDLGPRSVAARGQPEPGTWIDNGFLSLTAMDQAHAAILAVVGRVRSALDLGAGDGRLLWRLARPDSGPWDGVESDRGRVERGNRRHRPWVSLRQSKIQDADLGGAYDAVILMPGRLIEMGADDGARVRSVLRGRRLVLYAYGDWLAGGLSALAARAGLCVLGDVASSPGAEAAEGAVR